MSLMVSMKCFFSECSRWKAILGGQLFDLDVLGKGFAPNLEFLRFGVGVSSMACWS